MKLASFFLRNQYKNKLPIYHLHIPKTGGTSFRSILDGYFDFIDISPYVRPPTNVSKKHLHGYSLLNPGHFGYYLTYLLDKKPLIVTMLRNPVEHVISYYEHLKKYPLFRFYQMPFFENKNYTLENVLDNPSRISAFRNFQTHTIGLEPSDFDINKTNKTNQFIYMLRFIPDESKEKDILQRAKKRINEFKFIGITEEYQKSLFLLFYTFNWKPLNYNPKLNVRKNGIKIKDLGETLIQKIKDNNKLDYELYNHAKYIFKKRYTEMEKELRSKYYKSEFSNLSYCEIMYKMLTAHFFAHDNKQTKIVSKVKYDFENRRFGYGFHIREKWNDMKIICWSEIKDICIQFPLYKYKSYNLQIEIKKSMFKDLSKSLKVFMNNNLLDLEIVENNTIIIKSKIPKEYMQSSDAFSELKFCTDELIVPNDVSSNTDTRKLGLAFSRIIIN